MGVKRSATQPSSPHQAGPSGIAHLSTGKESQSISCSPKQKKRSSSGVGRWWQRMVKGARPPEATRVAAERRHLFRLSLWGGDRLYFRFLFFPFPTAAVLSTYVAWCRMGVVRGCGEAYQPDRARDQRRILA
jgi:hypothetical protein